MVVKAWSRDCVQLLSCFMSQFAILLHTFLCMNFHITGPWLRCSQHVSLSWVIFLLLLRRFWIRTYFANCRQYLSLLRIHVDCTPSRCGQRMMLVLPNRRLSSILSASDRCSVSVQPILMSSTYIEKNNPFSVYENIPNFGTFSQPCSNRTFSNCLLHHGPGRG